MKLVLPLMNNYGDLGGKTAYINAFGGNATSWYTDTASQAAYKKYINLIVNRYKSSPAIFAWELGNEPRCSGCSTSIITNWASDISAYIKSLDSQHLVAIGDEGWMTAPVGDGSYAYSGYGMFSFKSTDAYLSKDANGLQRALTSSRTSPSPPSTTALSTSTPINGATTTAGAMNGSCNTMRQAKQRANRWCLKSTARPIRRTTRKSAHLGKRPSFKTVVWPTTPSGSLRRLCP